MIKSFFPYRILRSLDFPNIFQQTCLLPAALNTVVIQELAVGKSLLKEQEGSLALFSRSTAPCRELDESNTQLP
jgi:hypothetical protein